MYSWSGRQRLAVIAAVFALIMGTTLAVVGWRLHHGWPVVVQSERVASYRIDTIDERTLVLSDVLRQWRHGTWWPEWSSHHHALQLVGDEGASLTVEDEHSSSIFLVRSGARRLPAQVDGAIFAAFPDVRLDLPGLPAAAVLAVSNCGGAPFYMTLHLIVLDPDKPFVRWRQELGAHYPQLIDADGDGVAEILAGDDGFAYWGRDNSDDSPAPTVILRWNGTTFEPATWRWLPADAVALSAQAAKRKNITPEQAMSAWLVGPRANFFDAHFDDGIIPPPVVTQLLLDLIYRGRGDLARTWLLAHWPPSLERLEFFRRFTAHLPKGRFFAATNALTPVEHRWPLR